MVSKLYFFIFLYLNVLCILSVKFSAGKFSLPKVYQIKSYFVVFSSLLSFIYGVFSSMKAFTALAHLSKFAVYFSNIFYILMVIFIISWIMVLLKSQETIVKILTIFYSFKNLCNERMLCKNFKKVKQKIFITFFIFTCFSLTSYINPISETKFDFINILSLPFYLFLLTFYTWCFWFFHMILIHYELLIENLNKILENDINLIHDNCEDLVENLIKIQTLFKLLNRGFAKIFTLIVLVEFLLVSFCVSLRNKF